MTRRVRRPRSGFTLWELTMVLMVMAIGATLAAVGTHWVMAAALKGLEFSDSPSSAGTH